MGCESFCAVRLWDQMFENWKFGRTFGIGRGIVEPAGAAICVSGENVLHSGSVGKWDNTMVLQDCGLDQAH